MCPGNPLEICLVGFVVSRRPVIVIVKMAVIIPLEMHQIRVIGRSCQAARVPITEPAADGDDDEYEDVEEDGRSEPRPLSMVDCAAAAGGGSCDLSMIMEQSYVDADFNLCLSG